MFESENQNWFWLIAGWTMHIVSFLLVSFHALRRRREATSTILWMLVAWGFPLIGPLVYLAFGIDRVPDKSFHKHVTDQRLLKRRKAMESETLPLAYWRAVHQARVEEPQDHVGRQLNRAMNAIIPDYPLLGGNLIEPLVDGDETFPAMLKSIESATNHVHLQSFIIRDDRTGRQFMDLLAEKARSGVKVRLMFDRFGSTRAFLSGAFRRYSKIPCMRVAGWTQANPFKRQFQINLRNHRKILIVDGRDAFCGGLNIHDDHSTNEGRPPIRDYHFRARGPIVQELQFTFMRDWYFMTDEDPDELLREAYFPGVGEPGTSKVRLINSGPASEMEAISDVFFTAITAAHKQILAVTPYFVPPREIVRAFRLAAMRGVDVRLVVPRKNNHVYARLAGCALYEELLSAGVRIFERRPPFMHAKALIVDDAVALVGTANLDVRSLRLNYETNLAIYGDEFTNRLKGIVLSDIAQSDEINLSDWKKRPTSRKAMENLAYLMMPIL